MPSVTLKPPLGILLHAFIFVCGGKLLAIHDEQLKTLVKLGNRPPLDEVTGPADLLLFATKWIVCCWQQSPDERPSFDGK